MSETESGNVEAAEVEEPLAPFEPIEPVESAEPVEFAEPLEPPAPLEPPVAEKRKFPWRWVGAVLTSLAVGTGCAFAVLAPQRTHLPGLATAADGRYTFAPLTLPTLAPGQAAPSSDVNAGGQHISDIRKLLLSPPEGATPDRSLPGASGWFSRAATLKLLANPQADEQLRTDGWRHTAAIAWKTPDGAETKIWLFQFIDSGAAGDAAQVINTFAGQSLNTDPAIITVDQLTSVEYERVVTGSTATWYGLAQVHDIEFLIEYSAPASIGLAPFQQEASLQTELLQ
jgi:hypothetical protein